MSTDPTTLQNEIFEAVARTNAYRAGNTELLEALMRFAEGQEGAAAFAQDVLGRAGMLNAADGTLNWQALEKRKPRKVCWELAVRESVSDPAQVERLLLLNAPEPGAGDPEPQFGFSVEIVSVRHLAGDMVVRSRFGEAVPQDFNTGGHYRMLWEG